MVNRIFHTYIKWYQYILLVILTLLTLFLLWHKIILIGVLTILLLIITIERIIHTTYTLTTAGKLIIYQGRFSKKTIIPIYSILSVKKCHSMNLGKFHILNYLLIQYENNKYIALTPIKEGEFIKLLNYYLDNISRNEAL